MAPVTQPLPNLVGGVSQAPPALRDPSSVSSLHNAVASQARGNVTRPPTRFAAVLADAIENLDRAFVQEVEFSNTERYLVVLTDGVCRVFDAETGAEQPVSLVGGALQYLAESSSDAGAFDAMKIGRDIFILNKEKVVALGTAVAPGRSPEALIYVRAGDFSTTYTIEVNGTEASYRTPAGTDASKREFIATDYIAEQIESAFLATSVAGQFTIARAGNVLYLRRNDNQDFNLTATDGLGGEAVLILKGETASADELPTELPEAAAGFVIEILGDAASRDGEGTYWLKLVNGRWEETARPGVRTSFDAATMPHVLRRGAVALSLATNRGGPASPVLIHTSESFASGSWSGGDTTLLSDTDVAESNPIPEYNGNSWTTRIDYRVNPISVPEGLTITAVFETAPLGSSTWTQRGTHPIDTNIGLYAGTAMFTLSLPTNTRWRVRLEFSEPAYEPVAFAVWDEKNGLAGLRVSSNSMSTVEFPSAAFYPAGAQVNLTVNGTAVSHTSIEPGQSAASMASSLAAAIDAAAISGVSADSSAGRVLIQSSSASAPVVTGLALSFDTDNILYDPTQSMQPGLLVGCTLESLVDGSTATVTDNGAKTITVSGWSGVSSALAVLGTYRVRFPESTWTLAPAPWDQRLAGDDESAPPPSFIGRTITGMFTYQNRLGFLCGDALVLSSAKSFFRFFRESSRSVLDADVIDVRSRARPGEMFYHAFAWGGKMYLSTERTQYRLYGDPMLTPRTIGLDVVSEFPVSRRCKPVVVGTRLYFATMLDGSTQVVEVFSRQDGELVGASLTAHVPTFLVGEPLRIVGDGSINQILVLTESAGVRSLYSLNLGYGAEGLSQIAWCQWTPGDGGEPIALASVGGDVLFIVSRPSGFFLEAMDLLEGVGDFRTLDAQVSVTGTFDGVNTSWTLPFDNGAGSVLTIIPPSGVAVTVAQEGAVAIVPGDHSGVGIAGYRYDWRLTFSPFFLRKRDNTPDRRGRLALSYVRVGLSDTVAVEASVVLPGRAARTRSFAGGEEFRIPILSNAEGLNLTLTSDLHPVRIAYVEWDGEFTPRTSRV